MKPVVIRPLGNHVGSAYTLLPVLGEARQPPGMVGSVISLLIARTVAYP
jgi:hypothetical protein